MMNVSRRAFLKGAGMTALAVAAAGVLGGCSKDPVAPATDAKLEALVCGAIIELVAEKNQIVLEQDDLLHDEAAKLLEAEISGDPMAVRIEIEQNKYRPMDEKTLAIQSVYYGKAEGETEDAVKQAIKYDLESFKANNAVSQISIAAREVDGVVYYAFITFGML